MNQPLETWNAYIIYIYIEYKIDSHISYQLIIIITLLDFISGSDCSGISRYAISIPLSDHTRNLLDKRI